MPAALIKGGLRKESPTLSLANSREQLARYGLMALVLPLPSLRQETADTSEFFRQIIVDNEIEAPFGQRLLLGANAHLK